MRSLGRALVVGWVALLSGMVGGCSSAAHSTAGRRSEPDSPVYLAQATCWNSVSCCVQRHPLTAVESCGADPLEAARILAALEALSGDAQTATAATAMQQGDKAAAEADIAEVEKTEDWSNIADLPEWKQTCIKSYFACKHLGWTGECDDCLRYCEGQQEWPSTRCGPRKKKRK